MTSENKGIMITGGTVNAGAVAAGDNAQAINMQPPQAPASIEEMRERLAELLGELRVHHAELDDAEQTVALAQLAAREAEHEHPNRERFIGLMRTVAAGVGSVASLAGSVTALEHAATALF